MKPLTSAMSPVNARGATVLLPDAKNSETPKITFIDKKGLAERGITYSTVHLLRLEADQKFPKRVYLSPARVVWIESEINEYLARCIAARG